MARVAPFQSKTKILTRSSPHPSSVTLRCFTLSDYNAVHFFLPSLSLKIGDSRGLGKSETKKVNWVGLFKKGPQVNLLSGARFFLFGSRDVWFEIGLPLFLKFGLKWDEAFVGLFLAGGSLHSYGVLWHEPYTIVRDARWRSRERFVSTALALVRASVALTAVVRCSDTALLHIYAAVLHNRNGVLVFRSNGIFSFCRTLVVLFSRERNR